MQLASWEGRAGYPSCSSAGRLGQRSRTEGLKAGVAGVWCVAVDDGRRAGQLGQEAASVSAFKTGVARSFTGWDGLRGSSRVCMCIRWRLEHPWVFAAKNVFTHHSVLNTREFL